MPEGIDLGVAGLASNFDWRTLVDKLADAERTPQRRLLLEQQALQDRKSSYSSIATQLSVLQNRVTELNDPTLFDSRKATPSDTTVATASVTSGTALGTYAFHITQRATAALRAGAGNIAAALSTTTDVSGVVLGSAPFSQPIKEGTFAVNGHQVTIATTDTLKAVFDKISAATGGEVTAAYSPTTDKISLTATNGKPVVLGSAVDSSNFLQVARLSNNGSTTVTSASALGSLNLTGTIASSNLTAPVEDGGVGAGVFKINGVTINYNVSVDSVSDILGRINNSQAGVTAAYDSIQDRFVLTNKTTGDTGIGLEEIPGSGNFLSATGLLGSSLQRGKDLLYTVNDGGQLSSHSNTITGDTSGIQGLSVTTLDIGDVNVEVANDTEAVKKVITSFIDDYNKAQSLIDTSTASSTDAKGAVTAGTLAGESDAFSIASELRRMVTDSFSFLGGSVRRLESLGITSNGDDNSLAMSDPEALTAALSDHFTEVKDLFTHPTDGLAVRLNDFLEKTVGDGGSLVTKQDNIGKQVTGIDDQISVQERQVQVNRQQLINSFLAMEQSQQQINQQLQFLAQRFGTGTK